VSFECLVCGLRYAYFRIEVFLAAETLQYAPSSVVLAHLVELLCVADVKSGIVRSADDGGGVVSLGHHIVMAQKLPFAH
jgi:hypothetical protein